MRKRDRERMLHRMISQFKKSGAEWIVSNDLSTFGDNDEEQKASCIFLYERLIPVAFVKDGEAEKACAFVKTKYEGA